jgi:hypothetical protein
MVELAEMHVDRARSSLETFANSRPLKMRKRRGTSYASNVFLKGNGKKTMRFEEAMRAMREGKRMRRPGWVRMTYVFMRDGKLYSHVKNSGDRYWGEVKQALITAEDWEIVDA